MAAAAVGTGGNPICLQSSAITYSFRIIKRTVTRPRIFLTRGALRWLALAWSRGASPGIPKSNTRATRDHTARKLSYATHSVLQA
jgi:hypothetical protein